MRQGEVIADRYSLDKEVGEGGMAVIWRARDTLLDRDVAIKFLFAKDERTREELKDRFLREARLAAAIQHRNVVHTLDFGIHNRHPFMVMEYLVGSSLGDCFNANEQFDLQQIIHIVSRTLQGLEAVHEAAIVHRDIKPENIFLIREKSEIFPKLVDFGISKSLDRKSGKRSAVTTREGIIIGTPDYMSPEQVKAGDLDRRTDIYSMGVILYEAISGQVPYYAEETFAMLTLITAGGAPPLMQVVPALGQPLSDVVAKAMHVDREKRYRDAAEMRDALLAAASETSNELHRRLASYPAPGERRLRTSRRPPGAGAAADSDAPEPVDPAPSAEHSAGTPPWVGALIGGSVLVLAAAVLVTGLDSGGDADTKQAFIVVEAKQDNAASAASTAPPPPAATAAADTADNEAPGAAVVPATTDESATAVVELVKPRPRKKKAKPVDPIVLRARQLNRSFVKQKASVIRCLDRHPTDIDGVTGMALRITAGKDGSVAAAEVLPALLARKPAGACIKGAVSAMNFGPQPDAITFRVPITARKK